MYEFGAERAKTPLSPRPLEGRGKTAVYDCVSEPPLAEVLTDPIVHAVMNRDGVTLDELSCHIHKARHTLALKASQSAMSRTAA